MPQTNAIRVNERVAAVPTYIYHSYVYSTVKTFAIVRNVRLDYQQS